MKKTEEPPPPQLQSEHDEEGNADLMLRISLRLLSKSRLSAFAGDANHRPTCFGLLCLGLGMALPNVSVLALLSAMGVGLQVYNTLSLPNMVRLAELICVFAFVVFIALYLFDVRNWKRSRLKLGAAVTGVYLCAASAMMMARDYPWAPLLVAMIHMPLAVVLLRLTLLRRVQRRVFYLLVAMVAALCSCGIILAFALWVVQGGNFWQDADVIQRMVSESSNVYDTVYSKRPLTYAEDCGPNKDLSGLGTSDRTDIIVACKHAKTILFMVWSSPVIAFLANLCVAAFALVSALTFNFQDSTFLERHLVQSAGALMVMLLAMYLASAFTNASMKLSTTLMAFLTAGIWMLGVWVYVEVGPQVLAERCQRSPLKGLLSQAVQSDWCKAFFLGGFGIFIPFYLFLSHMKMRLLRCRGKVESSQEDEDILLLTERGRLLMQILYGWHWSSILSKICICCEAYFVLQVGVSKVTYVLLSMLNEMFLEADMSYGIVIVIMFCVGFCLFLLPPVPGIPVYACCGVVLAEQGRHLDSVGYVGGCIIAIAVAFVLKLTASTGQYLIGFMLGSSVKVQKFAGVDKVYMRALEAVLKEPGISVGKVGVLVGGPDWPISVICGILRLSIPKMLLGTCPVLFVLAPCVLAGAFVARMTPGEEDSIFSALGTAFTVFSAVVQLLAALVAFRAYFTVMTHNMEVLRQPRPEHTAVAELTRKEEALNRAYNAIGKWGDLHWVRKVTISLAVLLQLCADIIFCWFSETAFVATFGISSRIGDPYEKGGLEGDPWSLAKPFGWFGISIFILGVILHVWFVMDLTQAAKQALERHPGRYSCAEERDGSRQLVRSATAQSGDSGRCTSTRSDEPDLG